MAASFWDSTQRRFWTFTQSEIDEMRRKLEESESPPISQYPLPDRRLLNIYFSIRKMSPMLKVPLMLIYH
jgi:cyclin C